MPSTVKRQQTHSACTFKTIQIQKLTSLKRAKILTITYTLCYPLHCKEGMLITFFFFQWQESLNFIYPENMPRPQVFESKRTPASQARVKQRLPKAVIFLTWFFAVKCIRGIIRSFTDIKKRDSQICLSQT